MAKLRTQSSKPFFYKTTGGNAEFIVIVRCGEQVKFSVNVYGWHSPVRDLRQGCLSVSNPWEWQGLPWVRVRMPTMYAESINHSFLLDDCILRQSSLQRPPSELSLSSLLFQQYTMKMYTCWVSGMLVPLHLSAWSTRF